MRRAHVLIAALLILLLTPVSSAADEALVTREFDVGAFLGRHRRDAGRPALGLLPWSYVGRRAPSEDDDPSPPARLDVETLQEILLRAVESVAGEEGDLEITGQLLRLRSTPAGVAAAEDALAALWHAISRRVRLEAWRIRVPPEGRRDFEAGVANARVETVRRDGLLEAARAAGGTLESATALIPAGRSVLLGRQAVTTYVADYDIEIAQDSAVGNPIVTSLETGWVLDVTPYVLPGGAVWLEVFGQTAETLGAARRVPLRVEPLGTLDLPAVAVRRFASSARVEAGALAVLKAESPRGGLDVFLIEAASVGETARPRAFRIFDRADLVREPPAWELGVVEGIAYGQAGLAGLMTPLPFAVEDHPSYVPEDELLEEVGQTLDAESRSETSVRWMVVDESRIYVQDEAVGLAAVAQCLEAYRALRTSEHVALRLVAGAGESSRTWAAAAFDVAPGRPVVWQDGTERAFVADWDTEVAQEARAGDPTVSTVFGGWSVGLRLDLAPGARSAGLDLDLRIAELAPEFQVQQTENECTSLIEVPRIHRVDVRQHLLLDAGRLLRVPLGRLPDGRPLHLEATWTR